MQKNIITTENLRLEASKYEVNEHELHLIATISNDTPLSYWFRISGAYQYSVEVTDKSTINMWIPLNDIIGIYYEQN